MQSKEKLALHHIGIDAAIDMQHCIPAKHWTKWGNYSSGWQSGKRMLPGKKRIPGERKWFPEGIRYWQRQEFQIIKNLRSRYPVNMLCKVMGVNRSGYYKWRKRKVTEKRYKYRKPGEESEIFPNLVHDHWIATRPLEIVISDITCIRCNGKLYEWVFFHNEISVHSVSRYRGDPKTYYDCLNQQCQRIKNVTEQTAGTVLHTDQGAVYSFRAFSRAHFNYNIIRSISRTGTPTIISNLLLLAYTNRLKPDTESFQIYCRCAPFVSWAHWIS